MGFLSRSPWVIHYDGSSCNGCDIEVLAALMPTFDLERFGIINTGNPKHADILLLTGSINEQNKEVVQNIFSQMPDPKVVVAIGICATSGGIFAECYNILGGADKVLPVDVYVPGCAVRPEALIDGVVQALKILEEKNKKLKQMSKGSEKLTIELAVPDDAPEILSLQKMAYQSEAELYNDFAMSPLRQTLEDMQQDFREMVFFKAVMNGQIVGSIRGYLEGDSCFLSRQIVHPVYQNLGIGGKLMREIEEYFSVTAKRYEIFTGQKSKRNIYFFEKHGYKIFKTTKVSNVRDRVYLQKFREDIKK